MQIELNTFRGELQTIDGHIAREADLLSRLERLPEMSGRPALILQEGIENSKYRIAGLVACRKAFENYVSKLELSDHELKTAIFTGPNRETPPLS